jgi:hypothetical protein
MNIHRTASHDSSRTGGYRVSVFALARYPRIISNLLRMTLQARRGRSAVMRRAHLSHRVEGATESHDRPRSVGKAHAL